MALSTARAEIIAMMFEMALYGMHAVLFGACLFAIFGKKKVHRFFSIATFASFLLSTLSLLLNCNQRLAGFAVGSNPYIAIYTASTEARGRGVSTIDLIGHAFDLTNGFVADSILIWRCFAIWRMNLYVCAPPAFLLVGSIVSGAIGFTYLAQPNGTGIWADISLGLTIATNVLTPALIVFKILRDKREYEEILGPNPQFAKYYYFVLALIVDTGFTYTACLAVFLASYMLQMTALFIIIHRLMAQVMGMVPTFIFVFASFSPTPKTTIVSTEPKPIRIEIQTGARSNTSTYSHSQPSILSKYSHAYA